MLTYCNSTHTYRKQPKLKALTERISSSHCFDLLKHTSRFLEPSAPTVLKVYALRLLLNALTNNHVLAAVAKSPGIPQVLSHVLGLYPYEKLKQRFLQDAGEYISDEQAVGAGGEEEVRNEIMRIVEKISNAMVEKKKGVDYVLQHVHVFFSSPNDQLLERSVVVAVECLNAISEVVTVEEDELPPTILHIISKNIFVMLQTCTCSFVQYKLLMLLVKYVHVLPHEHLTHLKDVLTPHFFTLLKTDASLGVKYAVLLLLPLLLDALDDDPPLKTIFATNLSLILNNYFAVSAHVESEDLLLSLKSIMMEGGSDVEPVVLALLSKSGGGGGEEEKEKRERSMEIGGEILKNSSVQQADGMWKRIGERVVSLIRSAICEREEVVLERLVVVLGVVVFKSKTCCEHVLLSLPVLAYAFLGITQVSLEAIGGNQKLYLALQWWQKHPMNLEMCYGYFANFMQYAGAEVFCQSKDPAGIPYPKLIISIATIASEMGIKNSNTWEVIASLKLLTCMVVNLRNHIDQHLEEIIITFQNVIVKSEKSNTFICLTLKFYCALMYYHPFKAVAILSKLGAYENLHNLLVSNASLLTSPSDKHLLLLALASSLTLPVESYKEADWAAKQILNLLKGSQISGLPKKGSFEEMVMEDEDDGDEIDEKDLPGTMNEHDDDEPWSEEGDSDWNEDQASAGEDQEADQLYDNPLDHLDSKAHLKEAVLYLKTQMPEQFLLRFKSLTDGEKAQVAKALDM